MASSTFTDIFLRFAGVLEILPAGWKCLVEKTYIFLKNKRIKEPLKIKILTYTINSDKMYST